MTKEEMQNSYIEMLIQDLEKHSFDYWESTQDEMVEALRNLQQENKQLKEQLLVTQTNEETFRLEMKDITQTLGLDEDTIFDDVKAFVRSLEVENKKYKEVIDTIKNILNNEMNYREFVDIVNDIEEVIKEVWINDTRRNK